MREFVHVSHETLSRAAQSNKQAHDRQKNMDYIEAVRIARSCGFRAPVVLGNRYIYSLHSYDNYSIWPRSKEHDPSWGLLLLARNVVVKLVNKKKSLDKVYFSVTYQGEQDKFYVNVVTFAGWYPHQYDNGTVCIGSNDESFTEFAGHDLAFALLNLKNALTKIEPTSVIRVDRRFAYTCKRCARINPSRRWTLEPFRHGDGYVCRACNNRLRRNQ